MSDTVERRAAGDVCAAQDVLAQLQLLLSISRDVSGSYLERYADEAEEGQRPQPKPQAGASPGNVAEAHDGPAPGARGRTQRDRLSGKPRLPNGARYRALPGNGILMKHEARASHVGSAVRRGRDSRSPARLCHQAP